MIDGHMSYTIIQRRKGVKIKPSLGPIYLIRHLIISLNIGLENLATKTLVETLFIIM